MERIRERRLRHRVEPDWFRAYREIEQQATEIQSFEPLVVPGLLQTEGYARALLGDDERVAARMARQAVIDRADVTTVVAERALSQEVGTPDVMAEQLAHLVETSAVVQVLPVGAAVRYIDLAGPFAIATVDGTTVVYTPSALRGYVVDDTSEVTDARRRMAAIRAEALPRNLSQDMILRVMEEWKNR